MEGTPAPLASQRMESAMTLRTLAEGHMEALAQLLATPERVLHPGVALPLLRADLELWGMVKALAESQIAHWSAHAQG